MSSGDSPGEQHKMTDINPRHTFNQSQPEDKKSHGVQNGGGSVTVALENGKAVQKDEEVEDTKGLIPFCIFFGFGSLFSSSLNVYLNSQITTLEKAFGFSSLRSGVLMSANDIGFISTVLFVSHFLKRSHIPRILAVCVFLFGASGLCTSLPQFIADIKMETGHVTDPKSNKTSKDTSHLCLSRDLNGNYTDMNCVTSSGGHNKDGGTEHQWVLSLIFVLMMIQGIAKGPRNPLSSTYIDNNTAKTRTGFYIGILHTFSIFGPMLALTLGGVFSKLPIDLKDTPLTPEDPRWLGAWWLGFVVFGVAAILCSFPICFFPRGRKAPSVFEKDKKGESVPQEEPSFLEKLKDMPRSLLRVLSRPLYMCITLSTLCQMFGIMATFSFGPKYVETQFNTPAWKANIILGAEKLVTTVLGTFLGGLLTRRLRLSVQGCLKLIVITRSIAAALTIFNYIFGCDNAPISGLESENSVKLFGHDVNGTCDCTKAKFLPMCVDGSQTYYSPCHAGCQTELLGGYSDCSMSATGNVKPGICDTGCPYLIPFIIANGIASLIGTFAIAPFYVVVLRSVDEKDRTLAVGLSSFLSSLLVFLPAPIVYGKVVDSVCTVWRNKCGIQGSCALYDITGMRINLMSVDFACRLLSVMFTSFALFYYIRKFNKVEEVERKENAKLN